MLILKRISFPLLLRQQQPNIFQCIRPFLLRRWLLIKVGGRTFEHLLYNGTKYIFFPPEYLSSFA